MIWWVSQPSRARSEGAAIAQLQEQHEWLRNVEWTIGKGASLSANFEIERFGRVIPLTINYPNLFPDMPPQVLPREEVRLSSHQYGAGGELCLEYRPDNWDPSYTGAMMIESAYRLLEGEEPSPGVGARVESAHATTIGQDLRGATMRFLVSAEFTAAATSLELFKPCEFAISERFTAKHWLAVPRRIGDEGEPSWTAGPDVPVFQTRKGFALRLGGDDKPRTFADYEIVMAIAEAIQHKSLLALLAHSDDGAVLLVERGGDLQLLWLPSGIGKRDMVAYTTVQVPDDHNRLPSEYEKLALASVAVVGCGSVGSKIAASLARAGVRKFVLVDGDVIFPGNLVRNDLDWRFVGLSKPDAVSRRIHEIRPSAKVTAKRILLGGQESSSATDLALAEIGKCDVIIDATADPRIYNLCASVARNEKKVLVWGEVFAGGIGGFVVRLRPDIEPVPHAARRQLHQWCDDRGCQPPVGAPVQYGLALNDNSLPLVADDADVSVLAAHMTRMTLDALTRKDSLFPHPAYAVGLKAEWIFDAPFDTWPVTLVPEGQWGPETEENAQEELAALAKQLFPQAGKDGTE